MTYLLDLDQEQRLESYEAIEAIYLEGVGDGFDGRLPAMSEIIYLQGHCAGMKQVEITDLSIDRAYSILPENQTEFPLVCHQCQHLNNGICGIKGITRNSNSYACDLISVDCPF